MTQGALPGRPDRFLRGLDRLVGASRARRVRWPRDVITRIGRGSFALVVTVVGLPVLVLTPLLGLQGILPPAAGLADVVRPAMVLLLIALLWTVTVNLGGWAVLAGAGLWTALAGGCPARVRRCAASGAWAATPRVGRGPAGRRRAVRPPGGGPSQGIARDLCANCLGRGGGPTDDRVQRRVGDRQRTRRPCRGDPDGSRRPADTRGGRRTAGRDPGERGDVHSGVVAIGPAALAFSMPCSR